MGTRRETERETIRVVVHGALGRMGQAIVAALSKTPGIQVVGGVDLVTKASTFALPDGLGSIPLDKDVEAVLRQCRPGVMVDFTRASAVLPAARKAFPLGVNLVIGTTGLNEGDLRELDALSREHNVGVFVAPNFALGAVLLIQLARKAARFFDYVEVTEAHHETKVDAPSGTALAIARALVEGKGGPFAHPTPEKEPLQGSRGGDYQGVGLHAMRMPGRMAHHEVVLGALGQTLTLRHDTINRDCYMPGIILAVQQVVKQKGLTVGLEKFLEL